MKGKKRAAAGSADLPVAISNPNKVFWPEEGYTKLDLAKFYASIFPRLAPYVKDRMLTLERCPDGMEGQCFYQKQIPKGMPPGTPSKRIKHTNRVTQYAVGGALETQLALVNFGCIAVHVMATSAKFPRLPDWMCFDLDPESGKFVDAARAALLVKEALDHMALVSFAKTSGSRGLHIFIPLRAEMDTSDVVSFAENVSSRVAAAHPRELTFEHSIAKRKGRVYLDPFRNGFGQTVVAPYSVRRRPKAPVSTPLDWSEVNASLDPSNFNIANFANRLDRADPWAEFFRGRQSLKAASKKLAKL